MKEITSDMMEVLMDRWILARGEIGKPLPIILNEYVYETLGTPIRIVDVQGDVVLVSTASGNKTTMHASRLRWRFCDATRETLDAGHGRDFIVDGVTRGAACTAAISQIACKGFTIDGVAPGSFVATEVEEGADVVYVSDGKSDSADHQPKEDNEDHS